MSSWPRSRLFQLSSHTHVRGVQWRTWGPPNTPCQPKCPGHPGNSTCVFGGFFCGCETFGYCSNDGEYCEQDAHCTGGGVCEILPFCDELEYPREDAPLYFSTDYSDPLQLDIRPAMKLDSPNVEDRTLLFCSVYDNGSTDLSPEVKRWSQSPYPPDITINFTGFPVTVPGSELEPVGVAVVREKETGREFWRGPKGIAILAGLGGAALLALAAGGGNDETTASPSDPND